jgi:YidC/Oxa1 family membrane protein insertase
MKQSLFIFPVMIGFFSFTLPVGLSLYWITFTLFGILQQYLQAGFGALTNWIPALTKYEKNRK